MSCQDNTYSEGDLSRIMWTLIEQSITLSILIEEYARATGVAFQMLQKKIGSMMVHIEQLHLSLTSYMSGSLFEKLSNGYLALKNSLHTPNELLAAHDHYSTTLERVREEAL